MFSRSLLPRSGAVAALALVPLSLAASPAAAAPRPCDDTCKISAATAYIDALVTHDASAVPLAPVCLRLELGIPTGLTGADIRRQLEHGPQYAIITGSHLGAVSVSGDTVTTDYTLDLRAAGTSLGTSAVHETFRINPSGRITRIVATFSYATP